MDVVINENDLWDLFSLAKRLIHWEKDTDLGRHLEEDINTIGWRFSKTKNRLEKCHTLLGEEIETNRNLTMKLQEMQEKIEVLEGKEILT